MISIKNLSVKYNKKTILSNLNLDVSKGEIICIVGVNGCGKTTLLKAISHLVDYSGEIFFENEDLKQMSRKDLAKKIALLSQMNSSTFSYNVEQIVSMGRYAHHKNSFFTKPSSFDIEIVENCMKKTEIFDIRHQNISSLSGGQLQRTMLASIFAQNPNVILLDEPTNHLDFHFQIELINLVKQWVLEENRCAIAVLHDINLALNFADKIALVDKGEIIYISNTENFDFSKLNEIYQSDIQDFMINSLEKWVKK